MRYPTVLGIAFGDLRNPARSPRPIILKVFANWVVAPALMTLLANVFLLLPPVAERAAERG